MGYNPYINGSLGLLTTRLIGPCAKTQLGYRCLAYGIACYNTKEWAGDSEAEGKFRAKIHELGQILRAQVVHHLLNVGESWKTSWAADSAATSRTEAGAVATDIASFEAALRREQR